MTKSYKTDNYVFYIPYACASSEFATPNLQLPWTSWSLVTLRLSLPWIFRFCNLSWRLLFPAKGYRTFYSPPSSFLVYLSARAAWSCASRASKLIYPGEPTYLTHAQSEYPNDLPPRSPGIQLGAKKFYTLHKNAGAFNECPPPIQTRDS